MNETPDTGQNGQEPGGLPDRPGTIWVEVARDNNGRWHWVLWSKNGRQMCRSVIDYQDREDVKRAVQATLTAIIDADEIEIGVSNPKEKET